MAKKSLTTVGVAKNVTNKSGGGSGTNQLIAPGMPTTQQAGQNTGATGQQPSQTNSSTKTSTTTSTTYGGPNGTYTPSAGTTAAYQKMQENSTYTPDPMVDAAKAALDTALAQKPGEFQSRWAQQIEGLMNGISNYGDFNYDQSNDPLYQMYEQMYTRNGQKAMKDTMAQSAALTGGYGNSWASSVGQQAYQGYMDQLNERALELRDRAYGEWQDKRNNMYQELGMYNDADSTDYGRYRDTVGDWQNERDYLAGQYQNERDFDYNKFATDRDYLANDYQFQANLDYDVWNGNRSYYQTYANAMLANGVMPSDEMLALIGLSKKDAKKLLADQGVVAGGSGTTTKTETTDTKKKTGPTYQDVSVQQQVDKMSDAQYNALLKQYEDNQKKKTTGLTTQTNPLMIKKANMIPRLK